MVGAGEYLRVTRAVKPVAELRPLSKQGIDAAALLQRWRKLPVVNDVEFRRDVDDVLDASL